MKVNEVKLSKQPTPKERNPVAAYAQRSGAGAHKDQNKKNMPARKDKHKKKDYTTESQINEVAPVVAAAAWWLIRWAAVRGAWPVLRWLLRKLITAGVIGGGTALGVSYGWDWVKDTIGDKAAQMLIDNKFEIAMAVALIIGAVVLKRYVEKFGEKLVGKTEEGLDEVYKQKAGDYARGNAPMPKKKKRGPHPLGGKLVGGV